MPSGEQRGGNKSWLFSFFLGMLLAGRKVFCKPCCAAHNFLELRKSIKA